MLALAIQRRLERGTTDEEVDALVERYKREHGLLFTVDTLEFLARGGRIGRAKAFAGQLMNVKPILSIRDGEVIPVKRVRGNRKAFQEFVDALESGTRDVPTLRVGIAHAAAPERAVAAREDGARPAPAGDDRDGDDARRGDRHAFRPGLRRASSGTTTSVRRPIRPHRSGAEHDDSDPSTDGLRQPGPATGLAGDPRAPSAGASSGRRSTRCPASARP